MDNRAVWTERVAEWKASGLTSKAYCEGKPFTAGGLRHWAHRLRQQEQRKTQQPPVRLARVVRKAGPQSREAERGRSAVEHTTVPAALAIECGSMRVSVAPGFDRELLAAVLEVVAARGGGR